MSQAPRFGIITIQNSPWSVLLNRWRILDSLGFDSAWVADHFANPWYPREPWLDGWTLLSALAANTEKIRLGTLVTNISLHNPALLARRALTVDHISGGRLQLGIGAGGAPTDHSMTGIAQWDARERVERLREFVEIVDRMLRGDVTSYEGRYYVIENSEIHPTAPQQPRPPLTIAAVGPKTLRIAAEYADCWNFFPRRGLTSEDALELTTRRIQLLNEYCAELGRDPGTITRSLLAIPYMPDTPFDSDDAFHDFVGRYREAGIDEFIFYWWREDATEYGYDRSIIQRCIDREIVERLAADMIPAQPLVG
ncbi:MAG: LLM class flavin-dependent oxidoreductase [Chloroflexota bacterium]|nr:LLM class flavin-dependent oxidoreductase [Chloroflexota bacterium]